MATDLNEAKRMLESALSELMETDKKRMRAEGQYETAMENLKKLGFSSISDATAAYKEQQSTLDEELDTLLADIAEFTSEFEKAFGAILNGK